MIAEGPNRKETRPLVYFHSVGRSKGMNRSERHLRLVTETIAAVGSTLDLGELFELIAAKVAEALEADACFVYLYDEPADELVLRASCRHARRGADPHAEDASGRGHHRHGGGRAGADHDRARGPPRPALQVASRTSTRSSTSRSSRFRFWHATSWRVR